MGRETFKRIAPALILSLAISCSPTEKITDQSSPNPEPPQTSEPTFKIIQAPRLSPNPNFEPLPVIPQRPWIIPESTTELTGAKE